MRFWVQTCQQLGAWCAAIACCSCVYMAFLQLTWFPLLVLQQSATCPAWIQSYSILWWALWEKRQITLLARNKTSAYTCWCLNMPQYDDWEIFQRSWILNQPLISEMGMIITDVTNFNVIFDLQLFWICCELFTGLTTWLSLPSLHLCVNYCLTTKCTRTLPTVLSHDHPLTQPITCKKNRKAIHSRQN